VPFTNRLLRLRLVLLLLLLLVVVLLQPLLLHPFNWLFSRTAWVSRYQLDNMQTICTSLQTDNYTNTLKGSPYSITERRVPELIPVLGSQPAYDVTHKPRSRLPLLSARPAAAVTPATLKRAATDFTAW